MTLHKMDKCGCPKEDDLVLVCQLTAEFVSKVCASIHDTLFDMVDTARELLATRRAFRGLVSLRPGFLQSLFILLEKAWVFNPFASRECGEIGQPHINTDGKRRSRQRFGFRLTCKSSKPLTKSISLDGQGLGSALQRAVQDDFDIP